MFDISSVDFFAKWAYLETPIIAIETPDKYPKNSKLNTDKTLYSRNTTNKNERDLNGQYAHNMEAMRTCGHPKGMHTAAAPFECLCTLDGTEAAEHGECKHECSKFKKAKK